PARPAPPSAPTIPSGSSATGARAKAVSRPSTGSAQPVPFQTLAHQPEYEMPQSSGKFNHSGVIRAALGWALFGALASGAAPAAANDQPSFEQRIQGVDISGVWQLENYISSAALPPERVLRTIEDKDVPLQPWADKL